MTDPRGCLCKPWRCENCKHQLGMVVGGEMEFTGHVTLKHGEAGVFCPNCQHQNTWYFAVSEGKALDKLRDA